MKVTDRKVAEFVGVTPQALSKWKKPQQIIDGVKINFPTGKHNLYKGARLAYFLLNQDETSPHNNLENIDFTTQNIKAYLTLLKKECKNENLKNLEEEINYLEEILKKIIDLV